RLPGIIPRLRSPQNSAINPPVLLHSSYDPAPSLPHQKARMSFIAAVPRPRRNTDSGLPSAAATTATTTCGVLSIYDEAFFFDDEDEKLCAGVDALTVDGKGSAGLQRRDSRGSGERRFTASLHVPATTSRATGREEETGIGRRRSSSASSTSTTCTALSRLSS